MDRRCPDRMVVGFTIDTVVELLCQYVGTDLKKKKKKTHNNKFDITESGRSV